MKYTPENIIKNLDKIGPWSAYGLARIALKHYFPDEYDEDGECNVTRECELMDSLGCMYWHDLIRKFQNEVGYNAPDGFDEGFVNAH
jgi:hypothetical protein